LITQPNFWITTPRRSVTLAESNYSKKPKQQKTTQQQTHNNLVAVAVYIYEVVGTSTVKVKAVSLNVTERTVNMLRGMKSVSKALGLLGNAKGDTLFSGISNVNAILILIAIAIVVTPCILYQIKNHSIQFFPDYGEEDNRRQQQIHHNDIEVHYLAADDPGRVDILDHYPGRVDILDTDVASLSGRRHSFPHHNHPVGHHARRVLPETDGRVPPTRRRSFGNRHDADIINHHIGNLPHTTEGIEEKSQSMRRRSFGERHEHDYKHHTSKIGYRHMMNKTWR
jgi:hypothetical protein